MPLNHAVPSDQTTSDNIQSCTFTTKNFTTLHSRHHPITQFITKGYIRCYWIVQFLWHRQHQTKVNHALPQQIQPKQNTSDNIQSYISITTHLSDTIQSCDSVTSKHIRYYSITQFCHKNTLDTTQACAQPKLMFLLLLRSKLDLWGSPFWVRCLHMRPFFNQTIEVVTFCLHGGCMLGVFLLTAVLVLCQATVGTDPNICTWDYPRQLCIGTVLHICVLRLSQILCVGTIQHICVLGLSQTTVGTDPNICASLTFVFWKQSQICWTVPDICMLGLSQTFMHWDCPRHELGQSKAFVCWDYSTHLCFGTIPDLWLGLSPNLYIVTIPNSCILRTSKILWTGLSYS